ncbi:MAG: NADPH-dependent FMN reductase, partial [Solirubrobacterales bacterium]
MSTIVAIPASLRANSNNLKLLRAARELAPRGVELRIERLLDIPPYDGDVEERDGIPDRASELKELLASADGLLISTPEYNRGLPGVAKNAIDWLSRPPDDRDRVFAGLPGAVIGSAGGSASRVAQESWVTTFRYLKMHTYSGHSLFVARGWEKFDEDGRLTDEGTRDQLTTLVADF